MSRNIWATDDGVYFGWAAEATEGKPPSLAGEPLRYVGDRHIVTVGPNGSGKTKRLLTPNLHDLKGWSLLVIDPKGELAVMTGRHRAAHGNDIILLNPFNSFGLGSSGFNPVAALDPKSDDFPDDALGLAEALIRVNDHEPHWSESAQDLICALILYSRLIMADPQPPDRPPAGDLGHVRWCLSQPSVRFRKLVQEMLEAAIIHDCDELAAKAGRFLDIDPENKELNSIVSTALTQTRWLDSRPVKRDLAKGRHDFSLMKQQPTTVYLILPARRLGTHSTWLRLMITAVLQQLMKDTRKAEVPCLLICDEFAQLGRLMAIEQNLALMRGYGVKLWAVFQDLSQAQAIYGQRWESFMGNAGVLQSFAPQDVVTAEYLTKRTGQTGREVMNWSQTSKAGEHTATGNITISQTPMSLMLPQDLRNMEDGFGVIFTHKVKGTVRHYAPYPTAATMPYMADIMSRDPSA